MKFERQRNNQAIPNKFELNNQQFLTFRNNPNTQNSGRTVYSQQFDYKSLDRYDKQEEKSDPNFNFRKNLKNLRSTDKYKQLKEQAQLFQTTQQNNESQFVSEIQRQQQLKLKLSKLKKALKREQKKQLMLLREITETQMQISQMSENQQGLENAANQLAQILKQNENNIYFMSRKLEEYKNIEKSLKGKLEYHQITIISEVEKAEKAEKLSSIKSLDAKYTIERQKYDFIYKGNQKQGYNSFGKLKKEFSKKQQ